jgi:hypothetical protein
VAAKYAAAPALIVILGYVLHQNRKIASELAELRRPRIAERSEEPSLRAASALAALAAAQTRPAFEVTPVRLSKEATSIPTEEPATRKTPAEAYAELEQEFRDEAIDSRWAVETKAQLETGLERMVSAPADIKSLECKASLCRLKVSSSEQAKCDAFFGRITHQSSPFLWERPYTVHVDTDQGGVECGVTVMFRK